MPFGWQELLIILVIVVLLFGGAKLAGVGKATGRAIREFKEEVKGDDPPKAPEGTAEAVQPPPSAIDATPGQTDPK